MPSGILWAQHNLGAEPGLTPDSYYGNYYAWGELNIKTYYDWVDPNDATQNYKYANGSYNTLTKYCNDSDYGNEGYTDELTELVASDDIATVTNSAWRMPTKEDFEELLAGTTNNWEGNYQGIEGLNGRLFTRGDKELFFPAAGYYNGSDLLDAGNDANLWSSSLGTDDPNRAWYLYFYSDYIDMYRSNRYLGFSVRPVL